MSINVYDNFFSEEDYNFIWQYCINASYFYGEGGGLNSKFNPKNIRGLIHEVYYYDDNHILSEDCRPLGGSPTKIINQKKLFNLFSTSIEKKFPEYKTKDITRLYINCFAPYENSYFHTDGEVGTTFLYYPNNDWSLEGINLVNLPLELNSLNENGETQFVVDNSMFGVPPVTNRLISFDANILHRATCFRDRHRFTIAIKYGINE